jgi:predicted dehydrogenase
MTTWSGVNEYDRIFHMTLKVGILGNGNAAAKHRAAYAELPELWEVVEPLYSDIKDICSPNNSHEGQAWTGLRSKKHVIVEKPPCGSLAEIDALIRLEKQSKRRIFPIFQLDTDATDITLHWKRDDAYWDGWRGKWNTALGGCLTTHGIHALHALNRHHGPFEEVSCMIETSTFDIEVEDIARVGLLRAEPNDGDVALDIQIDRVGGTSTDLGDSHAGYVNQFREIHTYLTYKRPEAPEPSLKRARQTMELLTSCYYSAYTGEPVRLPIEQGHPFYDGWQKAMLEHSLQHIPLRRRRPLGSM